MKMTKRLRYGSLLAIALILHIFCLAQQKSITGRVTDASNNPMPGVTVSVKNKTTVTSTNEKGEFSVVATAGDILVFTSVGYAPWEERVGASGNIQITLSTLAANNLNEVVVVGYGTTRKKDLTGSVATVTARDFQRGQISTPEQMIAGKIPGVSIISNSGRPGSGSTIRIRGGSSLRASNDPLIVIDNIPLETSAISGASDPLSFINPNDIESFTVLKDASAAAIYGARAANGVIIITTKKGTGGQLRVNFSTTNSASTVTKKVDVLNASQFRAIVNEHGTTAQKAMLGGANTNWQDEIYRTAYATDNNISVSGGIKKLPYRFSVGYANQTGVLKTDYFERVAANLVLNPVFFDNHLKVDLNIKGTLQSTRFANGDAIGGAISFDPTQPVYVKSNRFGGYYEWLDAGTATGLVNLVGRNPVGLLMEKYDKGKPSRSIGNLQLDYKFHFLPDLHANMNIGYDISEGKGTIFVSDSAAMNYVAGGTGGRNDRYRQTKRNTVFDFYLNYTKELKSIKSRVDVTAGYSYNNYLTTIYNFPSYTAKGAIYTGTAPAYPYNKPEHTLISFFGRANYSYDNRFLLTATLRRDGSSRFAPDNRWGLFPSVALAWNMKNESFLETNTVLSNLKLRLGYGITGQQEGIPDYDYLSVYGLSNTSASYQFGNTYYQMWRPSGYNPNIKWEQTTTSNIGLDFGVLNDRITGSVDVYHKKTTDLLNQIPQPAGTNFTAYIIANVGDMNNTGVEFTMNAQPVRTNDLTWDAGFNITWNKNEITNLTVVPKDVTYTGIATGAIAGGIGGGFAQIHAVGHPKNTFYLYKQVYDKEGKPLEGVFVDQNSDGIINQDDLYKGKNANPDVFMGFSTNVTYKKWSAGLVLRASIGNYTYNNIYSAIGIRNQILGNSVLYNASSSYLETRFVGNSNEILSDYYIQNASFLRMDNLTIGYNVGRFYHDKASLRLNAGIQNVFVITKYKGMDPEISTTTSTGTNTGIDNNFYPRPRIFSLGATLSL